MVPLPRKVQIEPVGHCNLRCPMCSASYRPLEQSAAFIDATLFRQVIDGFSGLEEVHLQGIGEPFLHPDFFDLVEYAVQRGVRVSTNSNLSILTEEMSQRCVTSGLETLHVSIDADEATIYGQIRVGASLERVLANINRLAAAKRRYSSPLPRLKLVMVLMRRTIDHLLGVIHLAHDHGFESVFVQSLSHRFREPDLPSRYQPLREYVASESLDGLDSSALVAAFDRARELAVNLGLELRLPALSTPLLRPGVANPSPRCDWPWTQAYVCYDGSVLPCCMVSTPDRACMGSLREASFSDIWQGRSFTAFRAQLNSAEPPAVCQSCAIHDGTF